MEIFISSDKLTGVTKPKAGKKNFQLSLHCIFLSFFIVIVTPASWQALFRKFYKLNAIKWKTFLSVCAGLTHALTRSLRK